ncbi:hypothetical protein [Aquitalea aquatica]|uniref:Uncharacterized protein n=1 Tax=Aquitalea aquatica TaxID=3044273 RepID=A0A838Y4L0_9NEIS|nr:hypothetical protein [Aquitalea magnusonii]MBA4707539.1 hypothetical protein [Aquitalea magnusonii]
MALSDRELSDFVNRTQRKFDEKRQSHKPVDGGGGGGHNDGMEARVAKLEALAETTRDKIAGVETRLAVIEKTMATKDDLQSMRVDLHKEINAQTWKLVTFVTSLFVTVSTGLVGITYYLATHIK